MMRRQSRGHCRRGTLPPPIATGPPFSDDHEMSGRRESEKGGVGVRMRRTQLAMWLASHPPTPIRPGTTSPFLPSGFRAGATTPPRKTCCAPAPRAGKIRRREGQAKSLIVCYVHQRRRADHRQPGRIKKRIVLTFPLSYLWLPIDVVVKGGQKVIYLPVVWRWQETDRSILVAIH